MRLPARLASHLAIAALAVGLLAPTIGPVGVSPASASEVTDKQGQAKQIADKIDALNARLMALASQSEVARQHLAEANRGVDSARVRVDAANADIATARTQLSQYAVGAYISGNDSQAIDAMLSSDPGSAPVKSGYVASITGNRADLLDQFSNAKQTATQEGDRLNEQVAAARADTDRIDAAQRDADTAVAEQTQLKTKVDGEVGALLVAEQQRRDAAATAQAAATAKQALAQQVTTTRTPMPGGSTTTGPVAPLPTTNPGGPPPSTNGGAARAVAAAMGKIGSPYVWAAAGPDSFDCSGLTMWAWAQAGVSLPHYTGSQLAATRRISVDELQPGDLVFVWGPGENGDPGHVGLYIGGGQMVHAPHAGANVQVDSIYWWTGARISAGRVG